MKIGFDVDGVLAAFQPAYQDLFVRLTGRDMFHEGDRDNPPDWHWPTLRGYTKEETQVVWAAIRQDSTFWLNLDTVEPSVTTMRTLLRDMERNHEIYFVTNRTGAGVKRQTVLWLFDHLCYPMRAPGFYPTVMIVGERVKGTVCNALKLDAYIDDNFDNVTDCLAQSPQTRTYLLNRAYNQSEQRVVLVQDPQEPSQMMARGIMRVNTLGEMFDSEIALGNL